MATSNLLKLATTLTLLLPLFFSAHFNAATSSDIDQDDEEYYILDTPSAHTRLRSRFLASTLKLKKGARCNNANNSSYNNICNGVSANNGTSILYCCKKHCRNVLGDRNNCGQCGHKCRLDQRCCGGTCTNVLDNTSHCGKCNKRCSPGLRCEYGYCGYA